MMIKNLFDASLLFLSFSFSFSVEFELSVELSEKEVSNMYADLMK